MNRTTVAVLYGGRSTEHSVSCVSAGAVMAHLDRSVYNVIPVGITESGVWTLGPDDVSDLRITNRVLPVVDPHRPEVSIGLSTEDRGVLRFVDGDRAGEQIDRVDVVFPVMHGTHAEDGTIQGLLELSGIPYVGPGVLASAAGMDKEFTKIVLGAAGLPIGHQTVLRPGTPTLTSADRERLGLPLFVKPARGGSSIGITKVSRYEDLDAAISEARRYDPKVIIEAAVVGREIECGVLEYPNGTVAASLPAELHVPGVSTGPEDEAGAGTFYDFDTKYLDNVTTFDLPAELSEEETEQLRALAVRAHQAIDARGLSRVDFFVTEDGPVINEINTMPGFTPISMYPQMWAATDVDYSTLLDTLLRTALAGR